MTSQMVMARRLRVFILQKQGLNPEQIHDLLEPDFKVSLDTIYRDLRSMDKWLPEVIKLRDDAEEAAVDLLRLCKIAQIRLLQLSHVAPTGSAQVGAAKALLDSLDREIHLRTVTGQFKPVMQSVELTLPDLEGLDEDAVGAIVQNFMDDEARKLRQSQSEAVPSTEERPEDGLDPDRRGK